LKKQEEKIMDNEKRMVDSYEVKNAIHIGDKEIVFGVDETKSDYPYIVCDCTRQEPLGFEQFFNAEGSTDYLEMMGVFTARISVQIEAVKEERAKIEIPSEPITAEQCEPNDYGKSIENKVVAIRAACLWPEYRTADNQLVLATGGFGTHANSRGRAVYTVNLYYGKESRWNREDILGIVKPEHMPEWAKEKLKQIQVGRKHKIAEFER
jgi:hypothetical protein